MSAVDDALIIQIKEAARIELKDCAKYLFFDESGAVLGASFQVRQSELQPIAEVMGDRDDAIRSGIQLDGVRHEVHRHHPPLVYGRTMGSKDPEHSVGIAVCKMDNGVSGKTCYGVITFDMPNITARMVPILQRFCKQYLAEAHEAAAPAAAPQG